MLKAEEVNIGNKVEKLVKLRNPWGKQDWVGDWSDVSPKWTSELRKNCILKGKTAEHFI